MKTTGRHAVLAVLVSLLGVCVAQGQTTQPAQSQQNQQSQSQDQYSGVSHPPPDETIHADDSMTPPPVPAPKPSAVIPMTPASPAPAPAASPAPASGSLDNTDFGIVTAVPAANSASGEASLQNRGFNADSDIVNYVPSDPNALGEGTNIRVRLSQDLSTTETQPGTTFRATVEYNVYKGGSVIIPAGSEMRGLVVSVSQGHHLGPHATIRLRPEEVILPDGTAYHLYATAVQSMAQGTHTNQEGGIEASTHYRKDAVEYGAGTGVAALAGGEIAGPVGAGVGSVVGASAVTTHMLLQHPQAADLPQGSVVVFSLTEPMELTPTKN